MEALSDAKFFESFNKAKKIVKDLSLHYKKIDACPNDCMPYWQEYEKAKSCHKYKVSRRK